MSRRRPRLKVVSHPLQGQPRHRIPFGKPSGYPEIVEFFTEAEWEALHPAERPPRELAGYLPGIGYIARYSTTPEDHDDATEEYNGALREHKLLRGIEV